MNYLRIPLVKRLRQRSLRKNLIDLYLVSIGFRHIHGLVHLILVKRAQLDWIRLVLLLPWLLIILVILIIIIGCMTQIIFFWTLVAHLKTFLALFRAKSLALFDLVLLITLY